MKFRTLQVQTLEARRLLALNPTAGEQEMLQLVNRFRTDPVGEFSRLIAQVSPVRAWDPSVQLELEFSNVNGNALKSQFESLARVPPVAWNPQIANFAQNHNSQMLAANPPSQFHSVGTQRRQALLDAGVNLRIAGETITSENIFGYGKSVLHAFAALAIDWQPGGPNGLRPDLGHRVAIMNPLFEEVGHSFTAYGGSNFGPLVFTQVFANIENSAAQVVGAIFQDVNASQWYEAGEGLGGIQIEFRGLAGTFSTTSFSAGGYQIALPPGTYTAIATGGGLQHPVIQRNITIGNENVWQNLVYDPNVIPPDILELNDIFAWSTPLTGSSERLSGLTIHHGADVDYFRLVSPATGSASFSIHFSHASGDLSLRLLNSDGGEIARSQTSANVESLSANLSRGQVVYAEVRSEGGARNGSYSLTVNPPVRTPPTANRDQGLVTSAVPSIVIDIIANDRDSDGTTTGLTPTMVAGAHPAFSIQGNALYYSPPEGYSGVHRASYTVTDAQGLVSTTAPIEIFVLNFFQRNPWHNRQIPEDVNHDGIVSPLDVLLVVNEINARGSRALPVHPTMQTSGMFGFVDPSADDFLSALDVVLVVNYLNRTGSGEGEPSTGSALNNVNSIASDIALMQLAAASAEFPNPDIERRKASILAGAN